MATLDLMRLVDDARDELIALCAALVQIRTINTGVMPTGNETPAAELLHRTLASDGIAAEVIKSAPTRGNIVAALARSAWPAAAPALVAHRCRAGRGRGPVALSSVQRHSPRRSYLGSRRG